jgi:hypothetical protein
MPSDKVQTSQESNRLRKAAENLLPDYADGLIASAPGNWRSYRLALAALRSGQLQTRELDDEADR